jgi:hypothetical protein
MTGKIMPGNIMPGNIMPGNIMPGNIMPGNIMTDKTWPGTRLSGCLPSRSVNACQSTLDST